MVKVNEAEQKVIDEILQIIKDNNLNGESVNIVLRWVSELAEAECRLVD